jgi:hypothetical protein
MTVSGRISVDVTALHELAARLRTVHDELLDAGDVLGLYREALGSERLAAALDAFASNWSHRREAICDETLTVSGFVQGAAQLYAAVEDSVAPAPGSSEARP